jgi:hypothetical protein
MRYLCPTERGVILLRYDEPVLLLGPDGFRRVATLPRKKPQPFCATFFQDRVHVAFEGAVGRLGDDGRFELREAPEARHPDVVVGVGGALVLVAAEHSYGGARHVYWFETPGEPTELTLSRELAQRLHGARVGSAPLPGEALVVGSGGVAALRQDGISLLWRSERPVLDAVRAPDGALWLLDSHDAVLRIDAGGAASWVRGTRGIQTSYWTDADGESEPETDDGQLGVIAGVDPLVTFTYSRDRTLVRRASGKPPRCWHGPPDHGRFLDDIAYSFGRIWGIRTRGSYHVMEATDDGTPAYRTVPLP